jgi:signal transduction histidine kinase
VVDRFRQAIESKGLEVRIDCPKGLMIETDRLKLERILQNLIGNSVKFTDQGSVSVQVETASRNLTLHVSDTGVGIPDEQHETIFEEFYQVHNCERDSTKGFGLGLAIARRLTRQLQGELVVASEPGRGSRFSVILEGVIDGSLIGPFTTGNGASARGGATSSPRG